MQKENNEKFLIHINKFLTCILLITTNKKHLKSDIKHKMYLKKRKRKEIIYL